jgi:hypothetical protein
MMQLFILGMMITGFVHFFCSVTTWTTSCIASSFTTRPGGSPLELHCAVPCTSYCVSAVVVRSFRAMFIGQARVLEAPVEASAQAHEHAVTPFFLMT